MKNELCNNNIEKSKTLNFENNSINQFKINENSNNLNNNNIKKKSLFSKEEKIWDYTSRRYYPRTNSKLKCKIFLNIFLISKIISKFSNFIIK